MLRPLRYLPFPEAFFSTSMSSAVGGLRRYIPLCLDGRKRVLRGERIAGH